MSARRSTRTRCSLALAAALLAAPAPARATQPGPTPPPNQPLYKYLGDTSTTRAPSLLTMKTPMEQYLGDTSTADQFFDFRPPKPRPAPDLSGWVLGPPKSSPEIMNFDRPVRPWGPKPVDLGGSVFEYMARIKRMNATGARKEIRGTCVSACTMYLAVKNVCVAKDALLWFHSAHYNGKQISEFGNRILEAHWPDRVRDWAERNKAAWRIEFTLGRALSGVQLVAMGVPACK